MLLQVNPQQRPSADRILQLPAIINQINSLQHPDGIFMNDGIENNSTLMATINLPKKINTLQGLMPKSNYKSQSLNTPKTTELFQANPQQNQSQPNIIQQNSVQLDSPSKMINKLVLKDRSFTLEKHKDNKQTPTDFLKQLIEAEKNKQLPKIENREGRSNMEEIMNRKQKLKVFYGKQKQYKNGEYQNQMKIMKMDKVDSVDQIKTQIKQSKNKLVKNLPPLHVHNQKGGGLLEISRIPSKHILL